MKHKTILSFYMGLMILVLAVDIRQGDTASLNEYVCQPAIRTVVEREPSMVVNLSHNLNLLCLLALSSVTGYMRPCVLNCLLYNTFSAYISQPTVDPQGGGFLGQAKY